MPNEREPYSPAHDAEDDGFGDDLAREDLVGRDESGFEEVGCCFPELSCMLGTHSEAECVSVDMMRSLFAGAVAAGDPDTIDQPMSEPEGGPF